MIGRLWDVRRQPQAMGIVKLSMTAWTSEGLRKRMAQTLFRAVSRRIERAIIVEKDVVEKVKVQPVWKRQVAQLSHVNAGIP